MKYFFLLLCYGLSVSASCTAQQMFSLLQVADSVPVRVVDRAGKLFLEWPEAQSRELQYLTLDSLFIGDADMVLRYQAKSIPRRMGLLVGLAIRPQNGAIIRPSTFDLTAGKTDIYWMDATESLLDYGQSYQLYLYQSLMGPVQCSGERPQFGFRQQSPYLAGAGVAVVLTGLGLVWNAQKKTSYRRYEQLWALEGAGAAAQPFLTDARRQERAAQVFLYSGLAMLATSTTLYFQRRVSTQRRQQLYDTYCVPDKKLGLHIDPLIDWSGPAPALGARFSLGWK